MRVYNLWIFLFISVLLIGYSVVKILTGSGGLAWGKFPYPAWASWIQLAVGIGIGYIVIRALLRGEGKKRKVTDEEIAAAKAELERLHLMEHGSLPEYANDEKERKQEG